MNVGKTLFAQVMEFIPWTSFSRIVDRYRGNAGVRTLSAAEHFRVMAFAQLTWRESLRDIEASLGANPSKLYGMGFRGAVRRTTLADANERRDWKIWADLAAVLIRKARKIHASEELGLDLLVFELGAFYVMDRGYLDFQRLYRLHQAGAFFVTRAKSSLHARRVYSDATDRATGVIADQRVMLEGYYSVKDYPEHIRRIRFKDPATDKTLIFLTNNTALPATTIADLYKSRWQVELFFKWIKQNLRIKHFFGTSENAVKTQIWCAVCTYVLIAIIKKELQINVSLYTCLQILSVSIFEKTELSCALQPPEPTTIITTDANQLILFNN